MRMVHVAESCGNLHGKCCQKLLGLFAVWFWCLNTQHTVASISYVVAFHAHWHNKHRCLITTRVCIFTHRYHLCKDLTNLAFGAGYSLLFATLVIVADQLRSVLIIKVESRSVRTDQFTRIFDDTSQQRVACVDSRNILGCTDHHRSLCLCSYCVISHLRFHLFHLILE